MIGEQCYVEKQLAGSVFFMYSVLSTTAAKMRGEMGGT